MTQSPTIGRIVHVKRGGEHAKPRAAIVAHVHTPELVNVALITLDGDTIGRSNVAHESTRTSREQELWDWPARVEG